MGEITIFFHARLVLILQLKHRKKRKKTNNHFSSTTSSSVWRVPLNRKLHFSFCCCFTTPMNGTSSATHGHGGHRQRAAASQPAHNNMEENIDLIFLSCFRPLRFSFSDDDTNQDFSCCLIMFQRSSSSTTVSRKPNANKKKITQKTFSMIGHGKTKRETRRNLRKLTSTTAASHFSPIRFPPIQAFSPQFSYFFLGQPAALTHYCRRGWMKNGFFCTTELRLPWLFESMEHSRLSLLLVRR